MAIGMSVKNFNYELQRDYLWEVILPDIGGAPGIDVGQLVQSVRFGDYNVEEVRRIYYGGFRKGYVGFFEIPSITLSILGTVPDTAVSYFRTWKSLMISNSGLFYPKTNYARDVYMTLLDQGGNAVLKFKAQGVFPTTFPAYDLSYESGKVVQHEVTLNVDMLEIR